MLIMVFENSAPSCPVRDNIYKADMQTSRPSSLAYAASGARPVPGGILAQH